ncbi:Ribosome-associated heat shock protein implicated in the recycling of the 50S subunit (S4 paralog) [hydrothermal vent metagenome]|uniref:Ribosome-associated heat shock protein implicated in the recycling of the 50S subunit (S4 paralog) n=1 Tax=hydrothermal vent metagenome TaxID=652676 RepID=A0A3B0YKI9_9ZZZZ
MSEPVRIDKWLWAARFYKTRSIAARAVSGGKVQLNRARVKPSRALKVGDSMEIHRNGLTWQIEVLIMSARRGPASVAQTLYRESEESIRKREAVSDQFRLAAATTPRPEGKPDKKSRRQLRSLKW